MSLITKQIQNKTEKVKKQLHREAIIKEIMHHQNESKQEQQTKIVTSLYNGQCKVRKYDTQTNKKRKMNSLHHLESKGQAPFDQLIRKVTSSSVRIHKKLQEIIEISHKSGNNSHQSKKKKLNWKQLLKNSKVSAHTLRFLQNRKTISKLPFSCFKSLPCQPVYLSKTNAKQFMNFSRGFVENRVQDEYSNTLNLEQFNGCCQRYTTMYDAYKMVKQQKILDDQNGHENIIQPGSIKALIFANERNKKLPRTSKMSYLHKNNFVF